MPRWIAGVVGDSLKVTSTPPRLALGRTDRAQFPGVACIYRVLRGRLVESTYDGRRSVAREVDAALAQDLAWHDAAIAEAEAVLRTAREARLATIEAALPRLPVAKVTP